MILGEKFQEKDKGKIKSYFKLKSNKLSNIFIISIFLLITVLIASLKVSLLSNWLYSSDLFTYDTILQETLRGNFGLEYTYGNSFGDHAYFVFLLLLPIKLFLKSKMIYFLVLITPLLFVSSCITLLYYVSSLNFKWYERIIIFIPLIFMVNILKANAEGTYGFHPDTGMGFLLFILAILFDLLNNYKNKKSLKILIWLVFILFIFTKEEMALLGAIFFGIILFFDRKRIYLVFFIFSFIVFILDIFFILESKSILNRGNNVILNNFYNETNIRGLISVLKDIPYDTFLNQILLYVGVFVALILLKKIKPIAFALFIVGLIKIFICFLIADFSFDTWHSFPALGMFIGAIIIQFTGEKRIKYALQFSYIVLIYLSIVSVLNLKHDLIFRKSAIGCIRTTKHYKKLTNKDIQELKKYIDKKKVIALNTYIAINFTDGYRYTFYPRGVEMIPTHIASYIIVDKTSETLRHLVKSSTESLVVTGKTGYHNIFENNSFILLERDEALKGKEGDCPIFIKNYGKESLGI